MSSIDVPLRNGGFGKTMRKDAWWVEPLLIFLGYFAFLVYANWRVLENANYEVPGTGYLAPMYSPLLFRDQPSWWPSFLPWSAAALIMWAPAGFRLTCYYYRGAYYKGFWADPLSCTVGEPGFRKNYRGERKLPLILQNVHRYFLYLALAFICVLTYDAWKGLWFDGPGGPGTQFGLGLGSIFLIFNPVLIGLYTLGCHSLRHLIGGMKDVISTSPARKSCYDCVSSLNKKHMFWAWVSMFYVGWVDFYIRMCAAGSWSDWRIF